LGADAGALTVSVNQSGLAPGRYFGEVLVAGSGNPPRTVLVSLEVLESNANPGIATLPGALVFVAAPVGQGPSRQAIQLRNPSRITLTYETALAGDARAWSLNVPAQRTLVPGGQAVIDVGANAAGLAEGTYRATLHVQSNPGESVQAVELVLIVAAGARPSRAGTAAGLLHAMTVSNGPPGPTATSVDCRSGGLRLVPLSTSTGFTARSGVPFSLDVRILDASGAAVTSGAASAILASDADSGTQLTPAGGGLWSGTLVPQEQGSAPASLVINAMDAGGTQTGCTTVTGTVLAGAGPVIASGRVLSPASFAAHAPLSPGGLVGILGARLAEGRSTAEALPLPAILGTTNVRISGMDAPLFFAGALEGFSQVNGVLPYGLATNTLHTLALRNRLGMAHYPIMVATAQPSVFTISQQGSGQGIVVHGDNPLLLADASAPVGISQSIVIYCEGLGPVTPEVAAGVAVPADPLRRAMLPVRVTVDGRQAEVLFAGLTPGFTGLYQVNAVVPAGTRTGSTVELVVSAGDLASPPVTIGVKP
jgi:adhesin/invasin